MLSSLVDPSRSFESESRSAVRVVNFKSYKYSGTTSVRFEEEYFTPTEDIHHISKHQRIESSLCFPKWSTLQLSSSVN